MSICTKVSMYVETHKIWILNSIEFRLCGSHIRFFFWGEPAKDSVFILLKVRTSLLCANHQVRQFTSAFEISFAAEGALLFL